MDIISYHGSYRNLHIQHISPDAISPFSHARLSPSVIFSLSSFKLTRSIKSILSSQTVGRTTTDYVDFGILFIPTRFYFSLISCFGHTRLTKTACRPVVSERTLSALVSHINASFCFLFFSAETCILWQLHIYLKNATQTVLSHIRPTDLQRSYSCQQINVR